MVKDFSIACGTGLEKVTILKALNQNKLMIFSVGRVVYKPILSSLGAFKLSESSLIIKWRWERFIQA